MLSCWQNTFPQRNQMFKILNVHCVFFNGHSRRSAQFEHTVVITSDGVEILTKLPEESDP